MGRVRGTVKWFDPEKGWGFIRLDSGQEVFVHHSDIRGEGFRTLKDGEAVELEVEKADRGPRARNVTEPGAAAPPSGPEAGDGDGRARSGGDRTPRERGRNPAGTAGSRPSGPGSRPLDEQVRAALGDRYPFAR